MNKVDEIRKILATHQEEVRQKYKAEVKGLFGSFVRGEEKGESDIDLLVDFEEHADLFDYVGLGLFLEEKLKRKVDIIPQRALREEIKANVLREAVYL
ncbi:MAG: nucleotidyltransferase family protein [candidate division KSB1 bacterium]|nr:nucleotidyltransferase family protein [candidate division KSB1 bacterium]MDZ7310623.1 nucleotidyltransferase family protein [candidate division KSB1 bacterium]